MPSPSSSKPATDSGTIALVGDVHSAWAPDDVAFFDASGYALILIAGDLGGSEARDGLSVARSIANLTRRTLVMPGNNDVREYARIAAELTYRKGRSALLGGQGSNGGVRTCGYSTHGVRAGGVQLTIITGRPFSMGGSEVSFPEDLERSFGVSTLEQSADKLCALVDAVDTDHVVFFAHNGPSGLGGEPDAPWGRDFHPDAGDWGDPDLREAIDYARVKKRRVLAVVAGHMHWSLRSGGKRRWQLQRDGITYVNTARVPRIVYDAAFRGTVRHHLELRVSADAASVREIAVRGAHSPAE